MKKYYLVILIIFSWSQGALASELVENVNFLQKAMRRINERISLWQRCAQGKCTLKEQAQIKRDLKISAAIIFGGALSLASSIGITVGVRKYQKLSDIEKKLLKKHFVEKLPVVLRREKKKTDEEILDNILYQEDTDELLKFITAQKDPMSLQVEGIPLIFLLIKKNNPDMLYSILTAHPQLANSLLKNVVEEVSIPLSYALRNDKISMALTLLRSDIPKVVSNNDLKAQNLPLYQVFFVEDEDEQQLLVKKIFDEYQKLDPSILIRDIEKIKEARIQEEAKNEVLTGIRQAAQKYNIDLTD